MIYAGIAPIFTGEVRVGAASTIVDVVFDTGSDWLVIPDIRCGQCNGTKVNATSSGILQSQAITTRNYGSASLIGLTYADKVCLTQASSSCITSFTYFAILNQTGLNEPIEGILGMCQNKQMMLSTQQIEVGPLFANKLFKDGKIPTQSFSFAMKGYSDDESSTVDFGNPDLSQVKGGALNLNTSVTIGFNDDFFWSASL